MPHGTTERFDRRSFLSATAALAAAVTGCLDTDDDPDDTGTADGEDFVVDEVADGFAHPWGLDFLPDGDLLVTEREGRLNVVSRDGDTVGETESVGGVPDVHARGQGGMLDVAVYPDFDETPWVYLTYSSSDGDGSTTYLGRGELLRDAEPRLEDFEVLHVAEPHIDSTQHYGSRVVFDDEGYVYYTTGDRGSKEFGPDHHPQNTTNHLGATLRLNPDGTVPDDNPFVDDDGFRDGIYSYGHRNSQGMTVHPETGEIWQSEHGEEDGDEINIIERGGNYGWSVAHTGCRYGTDDEIGDHPEDRDDIVEPVHYWECGTGGFPPAGATFYDGDAFPGWQGNLFVGNLAGRYLGRFVVDADEREVNEVEPLLEDRGWRVRDVEVAPDTGSLYVAVDASDAPVVRLSPA